MSEQLQLIAEARQNVGKGASRRLRRLEDKVPGIVYGGTTPPANIMIEHRFLIKALQNESFFSQIIDLKIDGKSEQVVLKDLQRHAYKPKVLHLDLLRVSATDKITMRIPLHVIGADVAPGVKVDGGNVSHLMIDVEIKCLPKDLPEHIEVDISHLGMDESVHLSELKLPKDVELTAFAQHNEGEDLQQYDQAVISIHAPRSVVAEQEDEAADDAADADTAADDNADK